MKNITALIVMMGWALFMWLASEFELTSAKKELEVTRMKLERCWVEAYDECECWRRER
jgi:hypothetical protein